MLVSSFVSSSSLKFHSFFSAVFLLFLWSSHFSVDFYWLIQDRARTETYREAIMQHQSLIQGKVLLSFCCNFVLVDDIDEDSDW